MRGLKLIAALVATITLCACSENDRYTDLSRGAKPLRAQDIDEQLVGTFFSGKLSGTSFALCLAPDGSARGAVGGMSDSGRWRIGDGGLMCLRWKTFAAGAEACVPYYQLGEDIVAYDATTGERRMNGRTKPDPSGTLRAHCRAE